MTKIERWNEPGNYYVWKIWQVWFPFLAPLNLEVYGLWIIQISTNESLDYQWIVLELRRHFQKLFQPIDKSKRDVTNSEIILLYLRKVGE